MRNVWWAAALAVLVGCGGSAYSYADEAGGTHGSARSAPSYDYRSEGGAAETVAASAPMPMADMEMSLGSSSGSGDFDDWESVEEEPEPQAAMEPAPERQQLAQAQPSGGQGATGTATQAQQQQATDAVDLSQPLLIYTAHLVLGVYEVEATQEAILGVVREVEGFLAQRSDQVIVVRVPAAQFQTALDRIEDAGDVLSRNVEAQDISEEYRDLAIRIRNAEAMRDRLERLLQQANTVEAALSVERELQRITEMIERMKGRLRFLSDRVAFSTITINFRALTQGEQINQDPFRLPFGWLDQLGLSTLLSL